MEEMHTLYKDKILTTEKGRSRRTMRSSGKEHELFTTENDQNEQTRAFSVKPTLSSRHRRKRPKD